MKHSDSERKEWRERMNKLIQMVRDLPPDKRQELAAKSPIFTPEGHALSIFNTCFLLTQSQRADLTICGGFRQWERAGAKVRGGEHAVGYIYVPMVSKKDEGSDEPGGEPVRFRLVPVFDVSQTAPVAVPA